MEIFKIYHPGKLFYKNHKETHIEALLWTNLMDYVFGLMAPSFLYKAMLQSEILALVKWIKSISTDFNRNKIFPKVSTGEQ